MHVIQHSSRIYFTLFLCLCAAVLLAPSVNAAQFDTLRPDVQDMIREVQKEINGGVNRPTGTTLTPSSSAPTVTKNSNLGLSASSNQTLKNMGRNSTFTSTSNYSLSSAKNALKSCTRSPSCAGRALGGGAIIYEGIKAWKDVYDLVLDDTNGSPTITKPSDTPTLDPYPEESRTSSFTKIPHYYTNHFGGSCGGESGYILMACKPQNTWLQGFYCQPSYNNLTLVGYANSYCEYDTHDGPSPLNYPRVPVPQGELDQMIDDGYEPAVSDAPLVLLDQSPDSIELSTPDPVQLPSTTTTNTSSSGTTTTITNQTINYNVTNNNTKRPTINSSITSTSTTYDSNSNVLETTTTTTDDLGVDPDPVPTTPPSSGASADIELPPFCTYASIVCDWIGWTKEDLVEEDPDLSQLITVFEPDEEGFDVGIGSGSCPAPMMLNLAIINKTIEVKYDPFCSFLEMIRPFVLAAAYLFSAYLYIGVLRRG